MHLPGPVRAAVGLVAAAADEVKTLPDRAIELPMLAVSTALQMSLRAQQRYAQLAARGEQVLNREAPGEDPPPWATFDAPVPTDEPRRGALTQLDSLIEEGNRSDEAVGPSVGQLFEELLGVSDPAANTRPDAHDSPPATAEPGATVTPISQAHASSRPAAKTARKTPARKTTAPAKKTAKKAPSKAADRASDPAGKQVNKPRHIAPSKFDDADDS